MARHSKSKSKSKSKRRTAVAKRRTAPARRRAYRSPARKVTRKRRNPKGLMDQPALQYAGAALAGTLAASAYNGSTWAEYVPEALLMEGKVAPSTIVGLGVILASWKFAKGKNRALGIAAGVGFLAPQAQRAVATALASTSEDKLTYSRPYRVAAPKSAPLSNLSKLNSSIGA